MPAISKIRLTNVVYEDGDKRFNDETFLFNGQNGAILLENGGGKTVFIHTILQAILPHTNLGDRKIKETLQIENAPAHIAVEWITHEAPRRYMTTAVSLFLHNNTLDSYRYVFEYEEGNADGLDHLPFAVMMNDGTERPAQKEEMVDYYRLMKSKTHNARTFDTIRAFHTYIEEQYQVIKNEWESIVKINGDEGGIEKFFENCKTTTDLYDRLLIPTVEDSISGHESGMFADMFEKQREGFQTYRNLQKSMEEHVAIQTELEKYVGQFKQYANKEQRYETAKQQAKGAAETVTAQRNKMESEKVENDEAWEKWQTNDEQLQLQTASFHITEQREKERVFEKAYDEKVVQYEAAKEHLDENENRFHSLRHAKYSQQLKMHEQQLTQFETELKTHDEQGEVADFEVELEIEHTKLHGYYAAQLEQLEKRVKALQTEQKPLIEQIEQSTTQLARENETLEKEEKAVHQLVGRLHANEDRLNRLRQQLLANATQENVHTEFPKWTARHQSLDEEIIQLTQKIKTAAQQTIEHEAQQEANRKELAKRTIQLNDNEHAEKEIQRAHDKLIEKLTTIRPTWQAIDDLYLKEATVYGSLIDMRAVATREREDLLYKERLARRFVDDYDSQESFFSDPFLAGKLTDWQNQFYVMTGPAYFANLTAEEQEKYGLYMLWPLTVVTIEADKIKLKNKITEIKDELTYPISILTLEEAKQIGENPIAKNWVTPTYWTTNLSTDQFTSWKENIREIAEEMMKVRTAKEEEVQKLQHIIESFTQFFQSYPKSYKDNVREQLRTVQTELETTKRDMARLQMKIEEIQREKRLTEENREKFRDELHGLGDKLKDATEYFQLERETGVLTKDKRETETKIATLNTEIRTLKRTVTAYERDKQEIDDQLSDAHQAIHSLRADSLYKEVKSFRAVYTDEAKEVIIDRRRDLQFKIHGIRQLYGEIKTKYDQAKKDIERVKGEIDELVKSTTTIDRNIPFPVDGDRQLERVRKEIQKGKSTVEKLTEEKLTARDLFVDQRARVKTNIERFETDFPNKQLYPFEMEFGEIEQFLKVTKQNLTKRKTYLQTETNRITNDLTDIDKAHQALDKFDVAHHFTSTILKAIALNEKEITEFTYNRKGFVTKVTNALQVKHAEREVAKEKIESAKQSFRTFCRSHITERKLREMAETGMETKTTYEDVLQFQQNMVTTVERADQYALDFISEKDKEVQAFINSIHNHLRNVTEQLRSIPKNTRVKVGEVTKEIFRFSIPEWTEEDGKTRIRNHMDWILENLEASHFKNDEGLEDSGKVRKQVETWLHTKSLLQVVMNNEGMKVACRKVTNDNQVTSRLTSWEQSNQWSGGEKWSKNMTLFLGILNFVAEKKQAVNKKMKRRRAVILDNPFGKASSDHVLNPVFFIAEQLGFQIIAFTAHADGKFLQDYFPIIYSLKLRATDEASKQVMTKKKSLHYAYFENHEPEEMKRLEEREQMELF